MYCLDQDDVIREGRLLPAFLTGHCRTLEMLPSTAKGIALIEVSDKSEEQVINYSGDFDLRWLHRDDTEAIGVMNSSSIKRRLCPSPTGAGAAQRARPSLTMKTERHGRASQTVAAYYRPHRRLFALDFGSAVVSGMLELAFPVAVTLFIDRLLSTGQLGTIGIAVAALFLIYLVNAALQVVVTYWGHMLGLMPAAPDWTM